MSPTLFVSVIIPTYHDWERLSLCIKALDQQTYPKDKFEVIVVNNDPNDKVPANYYLPANIIIVSEGKPGSYAARNKGIELSKGDILGFTDSDCIPHPDWIEKAVLFFNRHPELDRIAGKVELFFSGNKYTLAEAYEIVYAFRQEDNANTGKSVTANMFTRRKVLENIGNFDQSMISGGDFEWGNRANAQGYRIGYGAEVTVKHPARKDINQIVKKAKRVVSGKVKMVQDSRGPINKFRQLLVDLRPPVNEFKLIFKRGKQLSLNQKLMVCAFKYNIRIKGALEKFRVLSGAEAFNDI